LYSWIIEQLLQLNPRLNIELMRVYHRDATLEITQVNPQLSQYEMAAMEDTSTRL